MSCLPLNCGLNDGQRRRRSHASSYDLTESLTVPESQSLDRRAFRNRVMPSFPSANDLEIVDSPSTSHKLASFLSRPFRSNVLKRTKSVSKLDRKRPAVSDGHRCSSMGGSRDGYKTCSNNSVRNSRSHESLPNYSTQTHTKGLSRNGCTIIPLHGSLLAGAPHCFQISTPSGATKYYACRTAAERDRWLESLRNMQSDYDQVTRQENSLQLWIFASKGIPCKRKYYCELRLDQTLYCRTTSKLKLKDECFWGEHFEINHLPILNSVCINLYREADRKKKKDRNTLVGYVQIPVSLLKVRHPVEKWYAVIGATNAKGDTPSVRVKARYQTVTILPLRIYENLLQYIQQDYLGLCSAVEHLTSVKVKEDLASCLVHILHKQNLAKDFLCDLVMSEVTGLDNNRLMFRGNSLATKAMEAYMKLVGDQYLHDTLAEFIQNVLESDDDCEVDPAKIINLNLLVKHQEALTKQVHLAWGKIVNSFYDFPIELRYVFNELRNRLNQCNRSDLADYLISSNIFLRFLCPSILSPSLFNLIQEYPNEKTVRNLTLIAKTIQTLANFTKFGVKEHYMEFMNSFVEGEWDHMRLYLMRISSAPTKDYMNKCMEWDGYVDLGKELSLLHTYLVESWPNIRTNLQQSSTDLKRILERISDRIENPSVSTNQNFNTTMKSASPTSPISDYENNNGEPADVFDFARKKLSIRDKCFATSNSPSADDSLPVVAKGSSNKPASHLNSNDDYVWYSAIDENMGLRRSGALVQQSRQRRVHGSLPEKNGTFTENPVVTSPGELSAAVAVAGENVGDLHYVDDVNAGNDHDADRTPLRDSRGSLINDGPVSSGYHSLNYSTSNSSSPTEPNRIRKPFKYNFASTNDSRSGVLPPALAISNPLYCLQTVPLIKRRAPCYSMPDIQRELETTSSSSVAPGDSGSNDSSFDEQHCSSSGGDLLSSVKSGSGYQPRSSAVLVNIQKSGRSRPKGMTVDNVGFNSNVDAPATEHSNINGYTNNNSSAGKSPVPRTNPRYMSKNGRSPTLPCNVSSSGIRSGLRRTKTDFGIGSELIANANIDDEHKSRSRFLEELDETRRKLEEMQERLKEAEDREKNSASGSKAIWSEQTKPLINRLKVVEIELREELNTSSKQQQIIDAQQKRIELLQSANENLLATLNSLKTHKATINEEEKPSSAGSKMLNDSLLSSVEQLSVRGSEANGSTDISSKASPTDSAISGADDTSTASNGASRASSPGSSDYRALTLVADYRIPTIVDDNAIDNDDKLILDFSGLKTTEC